MKKPPRCAHTTILICRECEAEWQRMVDIHESLKAKGIRVNEKAAKQMRLAQWEALMEIAADIE